MGLIAKENVIESAKWFILPGIGEVKYKGNKVESHTSRESAGSTMVFKLPGMTTEGFELDIIVTKEDIKRKKVTKHVKSTGV